MESALLQIKMDGLSDSDSREVMKAFESCNLDVVGRFSGDLLESLDSPNSVADWTFSVIEAAWSPVFITAMSAVIVKIYAIRNRPVFLKDGDTIVEAKTADDAVKCIKALEKLHRKRE